MAEEIVNKVAQSGLITLDLEEYYPEGERVLYDITNNLWQGIALKEKDFRAFVKEHDWTQYQDKFVAVYCSADAIVPTWAYMLLASKLQPVATKVVFGTLETLNTVLFNTALAKIDAPSFEGARVILKGCGKLPVPESAYVELTNLLLPYVKSLMFGEPCSTVPIYKQPKK
jgi:hypothetical protein